MTTPTATLVRRAGSPRLTIALFALLALGVLAGDLVASAWRLAAPLALIALNLGCAIATRPRLRRGGLGVFHGALLAAMVVATAGRLMHLQGRVEIVDGAAFDAGAVEITSAGPLHRPALAAVAFVQGPYEIDYLPALKRMHTRSTVRVAGEDGNTRSAVVGDDRPLVVGGYRFYTTHNKGYAAIVSWTGFDGVPSGGAIHFPSYPRYDWKQEQAIDLPGATAIRVRLALPAAVDAEREWRYAPSSARADLIVDAGGRQATLAAGESLVLPGGTLRYEGLRGWMGYRIDHDPALHVLLACAIVAVAGLAFHVLGAGSPRRARARSRVPAESAS